MTKSPQLKKQKVKKQLILSAATVGTSSNNWRNPTDQSREFSHSLKPWIEFAKLAEKAKFHNIFFVDHLSWYDVYGGDYKTAAKHGVNATRIDPAAPVLAIASHTKNVGIAVTFSTVSEHPYHFARRLASLDLLSGGRIAWNIVSSYLPSLGKNLLNGGPLPEHDERYVKTTEYLDTVYELLLSSWRDDAVVYDKERGVFAEPEAIREINHAGKYFNVKGPAITEPSPQRFPLIAQAGTSSKGIDFAAENAELVFVNLHKAEHTTKSIAKIRKVAHEKYGRDPYSIKFIAPLTPITGKTREEAQAKFDEYNKYEDPIDSLVYFGGVSGIDVSGFGFDEPVVFEGKSNGITSATDNTLYKPDGSRRTPREISEMWRGGTTVFGTGKEIAEYIQNLVEATDIDGINFGFRDFPGGFKDAVDYLVPELQKLGLAQTEYAVPGGTLRENFYGEKGHTYFPESHPAYNLRWEKGVSKEQFEKNLKDYVVKRDQKREAEI